MTLRLEVVCDRTKNGDEVRLLGATDAYGNWEVWRGPQLQTTAATFPVWTTRVPIVASGTEFKLVILHPSGNVVWEPFQGNRSFPDDAIGQTDVLRMTFGDRRVETHHRAPSKKLDMEDDDGDGSTDASAAPDVGSRTSSPRDTDEVISGVTLQRSRPSLPLVQQAVSSEESASTVLNPCHVQFIFDNRGHIEDIYESTKGQRLGTGSFGAVAKMKNKLTRAERAVKTICKLQLADLHAFRTEIEIMKLMDHPNIIKLFEHFEDANNIYLVMELCSGGDLFDRIVSDKYFSEERAAAKMRQILSGICYMHAQHVMHRDIKPENFLFVDKEPIEKTTLKIIDFGLSKKFSPGEILTTRAGTPDYVAPEVVRGRYTESADLWSCGVMAYIMLCGYPPFRGHTDAQILHAVQRGYYSFDDDKGWKGVSEHAKQFIRHLVHISPLARHTAETAMTDVWITGQDMSPTNREAVFDEGLLENLRAYKHHNALKKATLQIIAWRFVSEDTVNSLRDVFVALDTNGDGVLSLDELRAGLAMGGLRKIPIDLSALMDSLDVDRSGSISWTEFLAATIERYNQLNEDTLRAAFNVFDKNGDGMLSLEELKELLDPENLLLDTPTRTAAQRLHDLLAEAGADGDGNLCFEDFIKMMRARNGVSSSS
eukprot:TRINITY_DN5805_c0_g1_i1.p1 TRINITY_DN5805_c0_g1~~TRINITY_DN5805_c0_g1_i1.p1  ORF type:complete len:655 (+),score=156.12 TRINITY_DN5805_c0_g1_i1:85-2049(+)